MALLSLCGKSGGISRKRKAERQTMTIQECYRQMGANYEDVLKRLYNEGMICKFTLMFLNDDSYPKLEQALKEGNVKEAFRAAHTLKGVCLTWALPTCISPPTI